MKSLLSFRLALILVGSMTLAACGGGGSSFDPPPVTAAPDPAPEPAPVMVDFEIQVTNLTLGQPMSPIAVIAHTTDYRLFEIGDMASVGLEQLAEAGDNSELIVEADADSNVVFTMSGSGPLPPGATEVLTLSVEENDAVELRLSLVSMLVNTNDALTAARNLSVGDLASGMSMSLRTISYDSGTEANTELSGTIPGPADGGEGFNAERDDIADAIRGHSGVVTADDGLATSVLNQAHRWDNPVAAITITRIQ